jgi:hypothetical protein
MRSSGGPAHPLLDVRSFERLQIAIIHGENNGRASSGGYVYTAPRSIQWKTMVTDYGRFDGTIGGIRFAAAYTRVNGWNVELNAR